MRLDPGSPTAQCHLLMNISSMNIVNNFLRVPLEYANLPEARSSDRATTSSSSGDGRPSFDVICALDMSHCMNVIPAFTHCRWCRRGKYPSSLSACSGSSETQDLQQLCQQHIRLNVYLLFCLF